MERSKKETVLVTGGSGFVGSYCIIQLLKEGYTVRTTIRSLDKIDSLKETLLAGEANNMQNLTFIAANLTSDENWDKAVEGCDYVLHVASPFPAGEPKNENEIIIPARDGAIRILRTAQAAKVKRVVLTSSFAAIGYTINPKNHVFTETDWTDPNVKLPAYIKSKTIAERAAWDFMEKNAGAMELVVINPVGIFGPVLGKKFSSSIGMIVQLLSGKMPGTPQLSFGIVDVRDVADIHIKAMKNPAANGQRFLATSDGMISFPGIAKVLKADSNLPVDKVPSKILPNWLVKVSSWFKPELKPIVPQLGVVKTLSNAKAKSVLNWSPRPKEATIRETAESLVNFKIV
ncbi:aldehyde reductase [Pedobacter sp. D749]|uniref:SDR family oxidoreductase n=1 Tax=Pedobacter sp. D749 TaxID=2856523 RepID=UPI001C58C644|nr:aldehyde reductase [Pedobacter sp. D749]QXU42856.1 aldehyde reductase [Pedobacter sp. D749]